jgi:dihydroxy-acid dehydratase
MQQRRAALQAQGGYQVPVSQTPWQELYRATVGQQSTGACMELATKYIDIVARHGSPRHSH